MACTGTSMSISEPTDAQSGVGTYLEGSGFESDLGENDAAEPAGVCFRQHFVEQEALSDPLQNKGGGVEVVRRSLCHDSGNKRTERERGRGRGRGRAMAVLLS